MNKSDNSNLPRFRQENEADPQWASQYFIILKRYANQIHWFLFIILLIAIIGYFQIFKNYHGVVESALEREQGKFERIP